MSSTEFEELDIILDCRNRIRKYYWLAAVLFWIGAFLTIQYYIVPTGTEPSLIPGILMLIGASLYFVVRFFNDY